MSRTAQIMLAVAVVALTAAATVSFAEGRDLTPLWIIGAGALVGVVVVDSRWVRHQAARVPFLRPGVHYLAETIQNGNQLQAQLRTLDASAEEAEWNAKVNAWYSKAQGVVRHHWPEYLPTFQRQPALTAFSHTGVPQWAGNLAQFMDGALERLHDLQMRTSA